MKNSTYFAIIGTSRNTFGGVRWTVTAYNSESDIVGYANDECGRSGESLKLLAGIEWAGVNPDEDGDFDTFESARPFADGEEFQTALTKLNDDGRTYTIFDDSKPEEVKEFLEQAEAIGLGEKAQELVEKFT